MNLNLATWQEFQLDHLFTIKKGKRLTSEEQEDGSNNYIGAIDSNNGVANHIAQPPIHPANTISVSYNGSVGEAFYQSEPYWATDDVNALYPRYPGFNSFIGLFIATVIRQEKYKFSYGRKWTLENMNKAKINLPALHNNNGTLFKDSCHTYSSAGYVPDWDFMEHYIKSLHYKPLTTSHSSSVTSTLSTADWKEFTLDAVFILKGGFYNKKPEHSSEGTIPFLASTESHNGVTEFYSLEDIESWDKVGNEDNTLDKKLYDGNCIAVTVNGSVCNASVSYTHLVADGSAAILAAEAHEGLRLHLGQRGQIWGGVVAVLHLTGQVGVHVVGVHPGTRLGVSGGMTDGEAVLDDVLAVLNGLDCHLVTLRDILQCGEDVYKRQLPQQRCRYRMPRRN